MVPARRSLEPLSVDLEHSCELVSDVEGAIETNGGAIWKFVGPIFDRDGRSTVDVQREADTGICIVVTDQ